MTPGYVEQREGVYVVAGTRVSLDSIVYAFVSGQSAEAIALAFPVLNLEQVYGAIAFCLAHRGDVDRYSKSGSGTTRTGAKQRATPTRCSARSSPTRVREHNESRP